MVFASVLFCGCVEMKRFRFFSSLRYFSRVLPAVDVVRTVVDLVDWLVVSREERVLLIDAKNFKTVF
jgi:hypothetical protein